MPSEIVNSNCMTEANIFYRYIQSRDLHIMKELDINFALGGGDSLLEKNNLNTRSIQNIYSCKL